MLLKVVNFRIVCLYFISKKRANDVDVSIFCPGLNKGNTKRKTTTRKKMFRIDFDATHDFDKLFSKGKVNQYKFGFELDSLLVRMH